MSNSVPYALIQIKRFRDYFLRKLILIASACPLYSEIHINTNCCERLSLRMAYCRVVFFVILCFKSVLMKLKEWSTRLFASTRKQNISVSTENLMRSMSLDTGSFWLVQDTEIMWLKTLCINLIINLQVYSNNLGSGLELFWGIYLQ